jgi:hypothetical protein
MADDPDTQGEGPYRSGPTPQEPRQRWSRGALASIMGTLLGWALVYLTLIGELPEKVLFPVGVLLLVASCAIGIVTMRDLAQKKAIVDGSSKPPEELAPRGRTLAKVSVALVLVPVALMVVGLFLVFLACMGS